MTDAFSTMVVPVSLADSARRIAAGLSPGGAGMWVRQVADVAAPDVCTGYISTGHMDERIVALATDAAALQAACDALGIATAPGECDALVAGCDVSAEDWSTALERMGKVLMPRS